MLRTLVALPLAAICCGPLMAEILPNGGFEEVRPNRQIPEGWAPTCIPELGIQHVVYASDPSDACSGDRSVSISIKPTHPQRRISYNLHRTVEGLEIGKSYVLSGKVKTAGLSGPPAIVVQCLNQTKDKMLGFASTQSKDGPKDTTDWTPVQTTFTVPDGTKLVLIRAGISAPLNIGGTVWFDDIRIDPAESK